MKKPLKFRVWNHFYKEFVSNVVISLDGEIQEIDEACGQANTTDHPERYTIQEFTGLLDKDGQRIFEGDILEITTETLKNEDKIYWIVDFSADRGSFSMRYKNTFQTFEEVLFDTDGIDWEIKVVGNIFETPELVSIK